MKIGIISDIHGIFPQVIKNFIADVDEIWCLGDIWTQDVLDEINALGKPVIAVSGNWEEEMQSLLFETLPKRETIQREGLTILLTHKEEDHGNNYDGIDLHCYGHIHRFEYKTSRTRKDGKPTFCLNPGAVTPLYESTASAVTIEIDEGRIHDCNRISIQCDSIQIERDEKELSFAILYDRKPKRSWIFKMFGTPWDMSIENSSCDTYAADREALSSCLVSGKATEGFIVRFSRNDETVGGAFISADHGTDTIVFDGIATRDKSVISPDDMVSIVKEWYGASGTIIKE